MSKRNIAPRPGSRGASKADNSIISRGGPSTSRPAPSTSRAGPSTSKSDLSALKKLPKCPAAAARIKQELKEKPPTEPPKQYENPAFSIPIKRAFKNPLIAEKDAKKTIRRNKPPGEDLAELKKIHASLRGRNDVTVGEYIALIAPSTGDNGELLRRVLAEEMNSFRKLAKKIYDTMTQDVSDVLTNQHIQLRDYETERIGLYTEKMMRAINEIYSYASKFDFEQYYADPKNYLAALFPIPPIIRADSDEAEMHRRQQAFHRLNWLRMEGDRLAEENKRLNLRLRELKNEQREEMLAAEAREAEFESKRAELEAQEAAMHQQLEKLTDKVEETIIDTEAAIRIATDEANLRAPARKKSGQIGKGGRRRKRPDWTSDAGAEIEERGIEENVLAEGAQSTVPLQSITGAIKKVRSRTSETVTRVKTPEKKQREAFHFSPLKTPPPKPPPSKERSPFHFSPIKTPPRKVQKPPSPFHFSPPKESPQTELHTTRVRREKLIVSPILSPREGAAAAASFSPREPVRQSLSSKFEAAETPAAPQQQQPPPGARRGRQHAPRDSWGGFY